MDDKTIEHISFLFNNERVTITANNYGLFSLPTVKRVNGTLKKVDSSRSPRYVVEHEKIKAWDPFITLKSGKKMRVYQGGDPTYMLVEVRSLLDRHDSLSKKLKKKELKQASIFDFSWDDDDDYGAIF